MSEWEYVSAKLGKVTEATRAIAHEVFEAAKAAGHDVWYLWGMGTSAEHATGRALDFMVRNQAGGDWVRNYIWQNRSRFGLKHVIWWQRITSTVTSPGMVRLMEDRGNSTANHYDHVHMLRFDQGYAGPTTPVETTTLAVDGQLGPKTIARWQQVMGTPVDGKISETSDLVKAVQRRLNMNIAAGLVVDGKGIRQDGRQYKTVRALQRYLWTPQDGVMSVPVSEVVKAIQRQLNKNTF